MKKSTTGFTIVELLIVIVVIAILAAITIVAYNGIQERAIDTRIKSDLSNAVKAMKIYHTTEEKFPTGPSTPAETLRNAVGAKFSYSPVGGNVILCAALTDPNGGFAIVAREEPAKGDWWMLDGAGGAATKISPASTSSTDLCAPTSYNAVLFGNHWVIGG